MCVDTLSYTRNGNYGPTSTKTSTIRFEQRLRGVLQRINAALRKGIIEDDIFNLKEDTDALAVDEPGPFETDSSSQTVAKFIQWLREQLNSEFLTVVGPNENPYLRQAFVAGIGFGTDQLQAQGAEISTADIESLVEEGRFNRGLQTLFTRTYQNLEQIAEAMIPAVREELTTGFVEGENPRDVARRLTDRIDSIGKHRATLLARTEMINAHTEGTLSRYEQVSEDEGTSIGVTHVGRLDANDARVCPFCRRMDNEVFTIQELRNNKALFRGTVYRLAPPSHPNGRCAVVPEIGVETGSLKPLSERVPGALV